MELLFERSRPGRRAGTVPDHGLPVPDVPEELARRLPPRLPEVSESELVRHFTALADRNFGIVVYGFGSYTSYMYPGGLDLEVINLI